MKTDGQKFTRRDTRPISSRWRVGRGSDTGGQGQGYRWAGAVITVGRSSDTGGQRQ